jgi:ribonuclease Z
MLSPGRPARKVLMSTRELLVLGSASQVPTRHRNHNGYLLLWDGEGILFDPGEGTQRQMTQFGARASQITRICVSHFHGDHCLGLAGIIQRISLDRVPHRVPVHYPASGQVYFDRLRHASVFDDHSDIEERPLTTPGVQHEGDPAIVAAPLEHTIESWGYRIQTPPTVHLMPERLAALGVKGKEIRELLKAGGVQVGGPSESGGRWVKLEEVSEQRPGRAVAVIMDTRRCDAAVQLAKDVDVLVIESTYLNSERKEAWERGHLTAVDAAEIGVAAGARRVVLTHFSQRYPSATPFWEEAAAIHPDVILAEDGARISCRAPSHE